MRTAPAIVIAANELRRRLRDRSAWIVGLVAPLVLATLIAVSVGRAGEDFHVDVALVDLDGGALAQTLRDEVLGSPDLADIVSTQVVDDVETAADLVDDGDVAAAIVVPAGYTDAASGSEPLRIRVIRSVESPIGADVAEAIARGFASRVDGVRLAVLAAVAFGAAPTELPALAEQAASLPSPVSLTQADATPANQESAGRYAPGMGLLFLFFTVGLGARSLIDERKQGTLARLLAAPVDGSALLLGKVLAAFALGVSSMATLAIVSSITIDTRWGGVPTAAALILAVVFAVTGIIAVGLTFARTEQQAIGYTSIVSFGMAILGGNFTETDQLPAGLRAVSLLTPNGWALRAWNDLAIDGGGIGSVAGPLLAILAFGAVTLTIAVARSGRLVRL